jgi:hypothetical protein
LCSIQGIHSRVFEAPRSGSFEKPWNPDFLVLFEHIRSNSKYYSSY